MQGYNSPNRSLHTGVMMFSNIYVTTANLEEARQISRQLVQAKLCACVNIHPIMSIYRWKGCIQEEEEYALNIKTTHTLVKKVTEKLLELHSYETPCIVSYNIDYGSKEYLKWISDETI